MTLHSLIALCCISYHFLSGCITTLGLFVSDSGPERKRVTSKNAHSVTHSSELFVLCSAACPICTDFGQRNLLPCSSFHISTPTNIPVHLLSAWLSPSAHLPPPCSFMRPPPTDPSQQSHLFCLPMKQNLPSLFPHSCLLSYDFQEHNSVQPHTAF